VTLVLQGCDHILYRISLLRHIDPINPNLLRHRFQWRLKGCPDRGRLIQRSIYIEDDTGSVATVPHARRRNATVAKKMSLIGIARDLAAHDSMDLPGDTMIEIPNTEAGGIGQLSDETEMADRQEKALRARSVAKAKVLCHPKPHRSKQTRTQAPWLWQVKRCQTSRSPTSPPPAPSRRDKHRPEISRTP
jgi:hypothetical protein